MWMWAGQHFFQFQLPCTIITKPILPQKAPCVVLWGLTKCRFVNFLLLNSFKFLCFRNKGECFYSAIALTAKTKQWNLEFTRLQLRLHGIASDWYISCIFLIILAWNQRAVRSQEFLLSPSLQFLLHPYDQVPGWIFSENQQIYNKIYNQNNQKNYNKQRLLVAIQYSVRFKCSCFFWPAPMHFLSLYSDASTILCHCSTVLFPQTNLYRHSREARYKYINLQDK